MNEIEVVDPGECEALISALTAVDRIAIDTEFMREKTFYAQLCLVQIATSGKIYCADPLTGTDLGDFWLALNKVDWVLHSGRQDIEIFYQTSGHMPSQIFDTQIAAGLLGYAPQMGYATLVRELFGKVLAKSHTRADWTRRPLSAAMIEYAAEDVEFLLGACDELSERLSQLGRLAWALEDSARLLAPSLYDDNPATAIARIKGAAKLHGRARSAAAALANWRERRAIQRNRPRQWILKDSVLLELALKNPAGQTQLAAIAGMPAATVRHSANELLSVLENAVDSGHAPPARPGEQEKTRLKSMLAKVAEVAEELGITAEIIAPKKELSAAALGEHHSRVFTGWRRDIVGQQLLDML